MNRIKFKVLVFSLFSIFSLYLLPAEGEGGVTEQQKLLLNSLPPDQRENVMAKMMQLEELSTEIKEWEAFVTTTERPQKKEMTEEELKEYREKSENWIYGYEIFSSSPTTFTQATDIPVPENYILGPGDQLNIQTYGTKTLTSNSFIARDGSVVVPLLGPVNVVGLTLREAKELIENKVAKEITGSEAYVSIGKLRTITIYILGEAYQPGAYQISSLSNISNALFVSGGPNERGSVRNIEIKRGGKKIHSFDLYKLLLEGDTSQDITLQQGDTIFVPLLKRKSRAYGSFRRPHLFELKDTETIEDLFNFAGGLTTKAKIDGKFELTRLNNDSIEVKEFSLDDEEFLSTILKDGDSVSARSLSSLAGGVIELRGEFKYPGYYKIRSNEKLSSVIARAGGLTGDAFTYGAVFLRKSIAEQQKLSFERQADFLEQSIADAITGGQIGGLNAESFGPLSGLIAKLRETKPLGRQVIVADPLKMKVDPKLDFSMVSGDTLYIPPRPTEVTIVGEILNPSSLTFTSGYGIDDYINSAGGYRDSADDDGVFLILPNGESQSASKRRYFSREASIVPGTTIVVPRDPAPFSWLVLASTITPILANSATAIATVEALLDN